jgi:hypothetical protein
LSEKLVENIKGLKTSKTTGISKSDEQTLRVTKSALKNLSRVSKGNEKTKNVAEVSENTATLHDSTPSNIGMVGEQMGTN